MYRYARTIATIATMLFVLTAFSARCQHKGRSEGRCIRTARKGDRYCDRHALLHDPIAESIARSARYKTDAVYPNTGIKPGTRGFRRDSVIFGDETTVDDARIEMLENNLLSIRGTAHLNNVTWNINGTCMRDGNLTKAYLDELRPGMGDSVMITIDMRYQFLRVTVSRKIGTVCEYGNEASGGLNFGDNNGSNFGFRGRRIKNSQRKELNGEPPMGAVDLTQVQKFVRRPGLDSTY